MSEHFDNPAQFAPDAEAPVPDPDPAPIDQTMAPDSTEHLPEGSQVDVLDVDANGLVDTLLVTYSDGTWTGVFDATGDGDPDVFSISTTGGEPDLLIAEDGAGGYLIQVDTDGDGVPDTEVAMSREELAEQFPAALEFLEMQFNSLTPTGGGAPIDEPVPPADGTGSGEWAVSNGQLIGDPDGAAEHWFEQAANGFCVPASITQIVASFTGIEFADESFFVERANELHLFTVGPDGAPSMTVDGAAALLVDVGIDAHVETDLTILDLANFLEEGRPVMLAVDADEMWSDEPDWVDEAANHAVVLTGIDPASGLAFISDPGSATGNQYSMPISELDRMWADSDRSAVVVDLPVEEAPDHGIGAAREAAAEPALTQAGGAGSEPDMAGLGAPTGGPVGFLLQHPWVVIPVVVGAGALLRNKS